MQEKNTEKGQDIPLLILTTRCKSFHQHETDGIRNKEDGIEGSSWWEQLNAIYTPCYLVDCKGHIAPRQEHWRSFRSVLWSAWYSDLFRICWFLVLTLFLLTSKLCLFWTLEGWNYWFLWIMNVALSSYGAKLYQGFFL